MRHILISVLLSVSAVANADGYLFTNGELITFAPGHPERPIATELLTRDGRIVAIGNNLERPDDIRVIDMQGGFLIPGLAEMHAHVPSPSAGDQYRDDVLFLWVAHGITTARSMLGHPAHLTLKEELNRHAVLGPRLITSGPSFNGNSVSSPEQAAEMVRRQQAAGYDFLKIHPGLTLAEYDAMAAEATRIGIDFAGHVPQAVGLRRALAAGQKTIDHLDGYVAALVEDPGAYGQSARGGFGAGLTPHADRGLLPELVELTRKADAWVVPTQTLLLNSAGDEDAEALINRPQNVYLPKPVLDNYSRRARQARRDTELGQAFIGLRNQIIKALHDGGERVLLGADSPQYFNVPGASIHRELESMVAAGLSPYNALASGTSNPARFFGAIDQFGTLRVGSAADLVLLTANPLADITNSKAIRGVMVRGRWLDEAAREAGLAAIAERRNSY